MLYQRLLHILNTQILRHPLVKLNAGALSEQVDVVSVQEPPLASHQ